MTEDARQIILWIKKQINIAKTDHIDKAWNENHKYYKKQPWEKSAEGEINRQTRRSGKKMIFFVCTKLTIRIFGCNL